MSLVVAWYCDDLRAGHASIRPGVTSRDSQSESTIWSVSGLSRSAADTHLISAIEGSAAYGGTPGDQSVISAIKDLKSRGLKVTLNPFILVDVPSDNLLPDPYSENLQPAYPWRGRITCYPAISRENTADKTSEARSQIDHFVGTSTVGALTDFGYRRMVLHYALLALEAGGVDTLMIGSEMCGLTNVRDANNAFPFTEKLVSLAADVRQIMGPDCAIIYGADWSEYFGYHPSDGSGDVFFHLDPLWSDPNITAVAIDNYMPLSDWRESDMENGKFNPDGATWRSDIKAFEKAISAGEGYDWYYASQEDRQIRNRTPITDGAYGKDWVFRYKDLKSWWSNYHYNRIGGIEEPNPTAWQPQAKQIWFSEIGCAAIHNGAAQPNAFVDAISAESQIPAHSNGTRDDIEQRHFLGAHYNYWSGGADQNPASSVTGLPMVEVNRLYHWAWDARPFPIFPLNRQAWADGNNWMRGHWLNGRLGSAPAGDLFAAIFADHDLALPAIENIDGIGAGMIIPSPASVRASIEPLLQIFGALACDDGGQKTLQLSGIQAYQPIIIAKQDLVDLNAQAYTTQTYAQRDELPSEIILGYRDPLQEYRSATSYSRRLETANGGHMTTELPILAEESIANVYADKMLSHLWSGRAQIKFALPLRYCHLLSGDVVAFDEDPSRHWLIERVTLTTIVCIEARSISKPKQISKPSNLPKTNVSAADQGQFGGPPDVYFLDLPFGVHDLTLEQFKLASYAHEGQAQAVYASPIESGYALQTTVSENAVIGHLRSAITGSFSGRLDKATGLTVKLIDGAFQSLDMALVLAGRNSLAVKANNGEWEVIQFQMAAEILPNQWLLTNLLRGQGGTEDAMQSGAAIGAPIVLLNDALVPVNLTEGQIGLPINYRIGPVGKEFSDRYFTIISATGGLRALMPLSPVHIRITHRGDDNLGIGWIRRSRQNGDSWLGSDIPLAEESEEYRIELLDNERNIVWAETTLAPHVTISWAIIDAAFSARPPKINIRIAQISQRVGRGFHADATLNLPL